MLLLLLALLHGNVGAEVYTAYRYTDPATAQRPELNKHYAVPQYNSSLAPLEVLRIDRDVDLHLYAEVYEMMDTMYGGKGAHGQDALEFLCRGHENVKTGYWIHTLGCEELAKSVTDAFAKSRKACALIMRPEQVSADFPVREFDYSLVKTLDGQIKALMSPFVQLPTRMEGIIPVEHARLLRASLRKVFAKDLAKSMLSAKETLWELQPTVARSSCAFKNQLLRDIDQLLADYAAADGFLKGAETQGLVQNASREADLKSRNLCRAELPYPTLSDKERQILSMYYGGVSWRVRGGAIWKKKGTNVNRDIWADRPFTLLAALNGADEENDVGSTMQQRLTMKGWSEWWDTGTEHGEKLEDLMYMTERGYYQIGAVLPYGPAGGKSADVYLKENGFNTTYWRAGGLQMGPCYFYTNSLNIHLDIGEGWGMNGFQMRKQGGGEVCVGAAMALGLSKSLLEGRECGKTDRVPRRDRPGRRRPGRH